MDDEKLQKIIEDIQQHMQLLDEYCANRIISAAYAELFGKLQNDGHIDDKYESLFITTCAELLIIISAYKEVMCELIALNKQKSRKQPTLN